MNICLLSDAFPPDMGGLARAVHRHSTNLSRLGHEVHVVVLTSDLPARVLSTGPEDGFRVHRLGRSRLTCDTLTDWTERTCEVGQQAGCQIYHGYFVAYAGFVATYAARLMGCRSVVSARGNDLDRLVFDPERTPFMLWALERADAITTVSTELRHKVWALSGREDAVWLPNGVDSARFRPVDDETVAELRASLKLSSAPVIGFVGESRLKKGLALLLRAHAAVARETGAQLLFVGGVRAKDQAVLDLYRAQHPELPVIVVPYQPQSELPAYYQLMDVVLFPSLRDGMPNALLEAMACGRPTISASVGGIVDVIRDGENGWLVPPANEPALIERLLAALADPAARAALGTSARRTVQQQFTPEREISANIEIYHRLLGQQAA